jgi:hypothetical protein
MLTLYSDIFERFKRKLLKDPDFFLYKNISDEEAEEFVNEKCIILLNEAISELMNSCIPDVDFYDKDDNLQVFNFEVVNLEKDLISEIMRYKYIEQDEVRLKVLFNNFTTKEVNIFSPAEERKSFELLLKENKNNIENKISNYSMRDRITGKFKSVVGD